MKEKLTWFALIAMALMLAKPSLGQTVITGKITDGDNGSPLAGASVSVVGGQSNAMSGQDGVFSLRVPSLQLKIRVSYLGYVPIEVDVNGRQTINVQLRPDAASLDEVVVVGYGTVKKSDLTGSVASVKGKDINAFPSANLMLGLSGRAAGVHVKQSNGHPGENVSIRVRGANSIRGDNEPLYVIDGFPSSPYVVNNADIESIEVLKDASATAIYGSRGANGVVLITTKSGKAGTSTVDYESSLGYQQLRKKMEVMNTQEYTSLYNMMNVNSGREPYFTDELIATLADMDWQDFIFQTAPIQQHSLSVAGGTNKTQFTVSGSYLGQEGIITGNDYNRYSLRSRISHNINERLMVDVSIIASRINTNRQNSAGGRLGETLIATALTGPPILSPFNEDGSYSDFGASSPHVTSALRNPLNFIYELRNPVKTNQIVSSAYFSYKLLDGLTLKVYGGIDNYDSRYDSYNTLKFVNMIGGSATVSSSQFTSLINENTINYAQVFGGKHSLNAFAGVTYQDFLNTYVEGSGREFLSDVTETHSLSSAGIPGIPRSGYTKSAIMSYLGRVNYSYDNRYLLTASFRADGASKYSPGNKWGYFPSAAVAWKIKEEQFLKDQDFISDLKLRASWGYTGSQAIGAYATLNLLQVQQTVFNDALYNAFAPSTSLPYQLRWESTRQQDIGVDFSILKNRISFTADYYQKDTYDLLNVVQLPSSMGFTTSLQNIGQVRNRGFEFAADATIVDKAFRWMMDGNISFNKSSIVELHDGEDILSGHVNLGIMNDNLVLLRQGQPVGIFYGYVEDGYTDRGFINYKDINADGQINELDKTIIGDPNPKFIYGLNSQMSYKNVDLSLFFQGSYGNDIANISSMTSTLDFGWGVNTLKEVYYNHWTPENPNAKYPVIQYQAVKFSDRFIEDGSYLRLRNIEIAYNFRMVNRFFKRARVFASGQNLLTFTAYSWWDPEVNSKGGPNSVNQGIDHSTYPMAKTYTMGLQIGF